MNLGQVALIFICINLGDEVFRLKEQNESKSHPSIYHLSAVLQEHNTVSQHTEKRMLFLSFFVIKIKEDPRQDEVLRPERFDSNRGNYVFQSQNPPLPSRNFLNTLTIQVRQC